MKKDDVTSDSHVRGPIMKKDDELDLTSDFHLGFVIGFASAIITIAMVVYVFALFGVPL